MILTIALTLTLDYGFVYTPMAVVIDKQSPNITTHFILFPTDHCRLVPIFRRKMRWRSEHVYMRKTDTCRLT